MLFGFWQLKTTVSLLLLASSLGDTLLRSCDRSYCYDVVAGQRYAVDWQRSTGENGRTNHELAKHINRPERQDEINNRLQRHLRREPAIDREEREILERVERRSEQLDRRQDRQQRLNSESRRENEQFHRGERYPQRECEVTRGVNIREDHRELDRSREIMARLEERQPCLEDRRDSVETRRDVRHQQLENNLSRREERQTPERQSNSLTRREDRSENVQVRRENRERRKNREPLSDDNETHVKELQERTLRRNIPEGQLANNRRDALEYNQISRGEDQRENTPTHRVQQHRNNENENLLKHEYMRENRAALEFVQRQQIVERSDTKELNSREGRQGLEIRDSTENRNVIGSENQRNLNRTPRDIEQRREDQENSRRFSQNEQRDAEQTRRENRQRYEDRTYRQIKPNERENQKEIRRFVDRRQMARQDREDILREDQQRLERTRRESTQRREDEGISREYGERSEARLQRDDSRLNRRKEETSIRRKIVQQRETPVERNDVENAVRRDLRITRREVDERREQLLKRFSDNINEGTRSNSNEENTEIREIHLHGRVVEYRREASNNRNIDETRIVDREMRRERDNTERNERQRENVRERSQYLREEIERREVAGNGREDVLIPQDQDRRNLYDRSETQYRAIHYFEPTSGVNSQRRDGAESLIQRQDHVNRRDQDLTEQENRQRDLNQRDIARDRIAMQRQQVRENRREVRDENRKREFLDRRVASRRQEERDMQERRLQNEETQSNINDKVQIRREVERDLRVDDRLSSSSSESDSRRLNAFSSRLSSEERFDIARRLEQSRESRLSEARISDDNTRRSVNEQNEQNQRNQEFLRSEDVRLDSRHRRQAIRESDSRRLNAVSSRLTSEERFDIARRLEQSRETRLSEARISDDNTRRSVNEQNGQNQRNQEFLRSEEVHLDSRHRRQAIRTERDTRRNEYERISVNRLREDRNARATKQDEYGDSRNIREVFERMSATRVTEDSEMRRIREVREKANFDRIREDKQRENVQGIQGHESQQYSRQREIEIFVEARERLNELPRQEHRDHRNAGIRAREARNEQQSVRQVRQNSERSQNDLEMRRINVDQPRAESEGLRETRQRRDENKRQLEEPNMQNTRRFGDSKHSREEQQRDRYDDNRVRMTAGGRELDQHRDERRREQGSEESRNNEIQGMMKRSQKINDDDDRKDVRTQGNEEQREESYNHRYLDAEFIDSPSAFLHKGFITLGQGIILAFIIAKSIKGNKDKKYPQIPQKLRNAAALFGY